MKIIGIDPGTGIVGFGIIESDGRKHKLMDGGVIKTPAHQELCLRLETIFNGIKELIKVNKPEIMVIEKLYFAQNVTTAMSVSHARGVIMLAGQQANLEVVEYTPLQIKQALTGYGRADKAQMQEMVRIFLNLKERPKSDDCADALAAALTHATASRSLLTR
jgi:crossover junction endodeoxyribonuclease RuvC